MKFLALIGQLYSLEREARAGPDEFRFDPGRRAEHSRPIFARISNVALGGRTLPESALGRAIAYMGAMWKELIVFVDEPMCRSTTTLSNVRSAA